MPTPNINIQNGQVTGTLQNGQPFYWYNPTSNSVTIKNCGTWCAADSYTIAAGSYAQAAIQNTPNTSGWAWTENPNQWNTPGMPHIGNPPWPTPQEDQEDKEVA